MSRGLSAQTKLVVEIIEEMLDHAAGDLTPQMDDIADVFRRRAGVRTREAESRVRASLTAAINVLADDGWYAVKVTDYYVENYRGGLGDAKHPTTDVEIMRSVAGGGMTTATAAIHFCPSDDCVLFTAAFCMNAKSGERKIAKTVGRMQGMAEYGLLTTDGIETVAVHAGLSPRKDVTKALRIAGRLSQQRLALVAGDR